MSQRTISINYKASPTLAKFHKSNKFHRLVRGPVGSGKSTGMCVEIFRRACEQSPQQDGIRRTRFAIVRSTYRELQDTTLKTWLDWFPEDLGQSKLNRSEMTHQLRFNDVECEVMFRALDRPDDVKKLLSLELTGAWINEARETPKAIVDAMGDRVGRYPSVKDGGCTWRGILLDTNPPDDDHWLYRLAEVDRPDNWDFFTQPGGLIESADGIFAANPDAENLDNIEPGYYLTRMSGKNPDHIRVYYCNQYGFVRDGKPVYPEYVDAVHCASDLIAVNPSQPLYIGIDFGLTPAATFGQRDVFGRISLIDELVTDDMGAVRFGELLRAKLQSDYYELLSHPRDIILHGDPAGDQRAQTDEATPFMILNNILSDLNLTVVPAHTNDPVIRREAVAVPLSRLVDGRPGMMISPKCAVLRKGLAGGYSYKRLNVAGDERYQDKPDKGKYSHVCFVAGTMVSTPHGPRAIDALAVGDLVNTPYGPRRVAFTASRRAETLELSISKGNPITCTKDHPFWAFYGFLSADMLQYKDNLAVEDSAWKFLFRLHRRMVGLSGQYTSLWECGTTASQADTSRRSMTRHLALGTCTESCGNIIMELFRMVSLSTTSTAELTTTIPIILRSFLLRTTQGCTCQSLGGLKRAKLILAEPLKPLRNGADAIQRRPRKWLGLAEQQLGNPARQPLRLAMCAPTVVSCTRSLRMTHTALSSARRIVDATTAATQVLTTLTARAAYAVVCFALIGTRKSRVAKIIAKREAGEAEVFCIEVEDAHCYYANGVLVSNCDAHQYMCLAMGEGRALTVQPVKPYVRQPRPRAREF